MNDFTDARKTFSKYATDKGWKLFDHFEEAKTNYGGPNHKLSYDANITQLAIGQSKILLFLRRSAGEGSGFITRNFLVAESKIKQKINGYIRIVSRYEPNPLWEDPGSIIKKLGNKGVKVGFSDGVDPGSVFNNEFWQWYEKQNREILIFVEGDKCSVGYEGYPDNNKIDQLLEDQALITQYLNGGFKIS